MSSQSSELYRTTNIEIKHVHINMARRSLSIFPVTQGVQDSQAWAVLGNRVYCFQSPSSLSHLFLHCLSKMSATLIFSPSLAAVFFVMEGEISPSHTGQLFQHCLVHVQLTLLALNLFPHCCCLFSKSCWYAEISWSSHFQEELSQKKGI